MVLKMVSFHSNPSSTEEMVKKKVFDSFTNCPFVNKVKRTNLKGVSISIMVVTWPANLEAPFEGQNVQCLTDIKD